MEELKKCPFCGCYPKTITNRMADEFVKHSRVFCANILCPIQPATRRRATMTSAIMDWNERNKNENS